jgi:hypothetical protein
LLLPEPGQGGCMGSPPHLPCLLARARSGSTVHQLFTSSKHINHMNTTHPSHHFRRPVQSLLDPSPLNGRCDPSFRVPLHLPRDQPCRHPPTIPLIAVEREKDLRHRCAIGVVRSGRIVLLEHNLEVAQR